MSPHRAGFPGRRCAVAAAAVAEGVLLLSAPSALALTVTAASPPPAVAGTPLSATVATFDDPSLFCQASSGYSANVAWGDGTPVDTTSARITGPTRSGLTDCNYSVTAGHRYITPGTRTFTVSVTSGTSTASDAGTATVKDTPITPGTGSAFSATAGVPYSGSLATFSDANAFLPASAFSATIDWGDGSGPSAGTVNAAASGGFEVDGQHTYAGSGSDTTTVTISDGYTESATVTGAASVAPATTVGTGTATTGPGTTTTGSGGATGAGTAGAGAAPTGTGMPGTGAAGGTPGSTGVADTAPPGESAGTGPAAAARFALGLSHAALGAGRELSVRVACPREEMTCRGELNVSGMAGHRTIQLGSALFILRGGRTGIVGVPLAAATLRRLTTGHRIRVRFSVTAADPSLGRTAAVSARFTLTR